MKESGHSNVSDSAVLKEYVSRVGGSWDDALSKKFFDNLKRAGYHALIDDKDEGVISDSPLVLLSKEFFGNANVEDITEKSMELAEKSLTEILHRKH